MPKRIVRGILFVLWIAGSIVGVLGFLIMVSIGAGPEPAGTYDAEGQIGAAMFIGGIVVGGLAYWLGDFD